MSPMRSRHARLFAISLFLVVLTASATQARHSQEPAAAPLATPNPAAAFLDPLDDFDPARWHKAD